MSLPAMTNRGSSSTSIDSDSGVEQESDLQLEPASDEGVENDILCGRRSDPGRDPEIAKIHFTFRDSHEDFGLGQNIPIQSMPLWH